METIRASLGKLMAFNFWTFVSIYWKAYFGCMWYLPEQQVSTLKASTLKGFPIAEKALQEVSRYYYYCLEGKSGRNIWSMYLGGSGPLLGQLQAFAYTSRDLLANLLWLPLAFSWSGS